MGTIDNFDAPDATDFGLSDQIPIKDASTSRAGYATGEYVLSGLSAVVNATASTLTVTRATHGNRVITLNRAAGIAVTLPVAAGTGAKYTFFCGTTVTSNSTTIKVPDTSGTMSGICITLQDGGDTMVGFETAADTDTITWNGTTTGGVLGDSVDLIDVAANKWLARVFQSSTGTEATPFSATV